MIVLISLSILLFVALVAIFWQKPLYGLLAIIFLLPFERIGSYSLNPGVDHPMVRLVQIASAAFILTYALGILMSRFEIRKIPPLRRLLLFMFSALVSALLVNYFRVWQIYTWLIFVSALFFLSGQVATRENLPKLLRALFLSAAIVSVFGLFQYLGDIAGLPNNFTGLKFMYSTLGSGFGFPRIQSTSLEPLYYANYLLLPALVGLGLIFSAKKKMPGLYWLLLILIGANFVLTLSRGAFLAIIPALLVLIVLLREEFVVWFKMNLKGLSVVLLAILLISFSALEFASFKTYRNLTGGPAKFIEALSSKALKTPSFEERSVARDMGWEVFRTHPIFGVGLGGYAPYRLNYPKARGDISWIVVNNEYIEILAETGIVGLTLYLSFIFSVLYFGYKRFVKEKDLRTRGVLAGLIAAVIAIQFQYQTFSGFFITHIWVTSALLSGLSADAKMLRVSIRNLRQFI